MHSWNRSCTGCTPRPGSEPGARYSMHWTGQNSGHFPHGKQRFTSMNATSRGRFFFSLTSSGQGASGIRSSFRRRLMMSIADIRSGYHGRCCETIARRLGPPAWRRPPTCANYRLVVPADCVASVSAATDARGDPSAGEPVDQRQHEADQAAHDGAVQADELEVGADAVLDLAHELLVAQSLEALADGEPDL